MILVVGDVMTDLIVNAAARFAHATDTPAEIVARPGGSGANIACWLGHLRAGTAFAGRVGRADAAAHEAALRAHGVRTHLAIDPARSTGRTVAIVDTDGERSFYTDRGANLGLCAADLPERLLDGCALLHVSGHTLFAPGPRGAALALMRAARRRGCTVSIDAGSAASLRDHAPSFAAWMADAALVFANASEAALIGPPPAGAIVVTTKGAGGATAVRDGEAVREPAREVGVVDAIGAGDAFVAGFLAAWVQGRGLRPSLQAGVLAGAEALGRAGGRPDAGVLAEGGLGSDIA